MASSTALPIPIPSAAASADWISVAKAAGGLLATVVAALAAVALRAAGYLWTATAWLLVRLYIIAAWPVARLFGILQFAFSPVTYTLSYALKPLNAALGLLGRLRPLYTYIGSAAFIGIVTGLVLKFASDYIVAVLSLDADADANADAGKRWPSQPGSALASGPLTKTTRSASTASSATTTAASSQLPKIEDDKSDTVQDDAWQWLEEFNPPQPAVATGSSSAFADAPSLLRKQRPPGLLSLTILEESSSEGGRS